MSMTKRVTHVVVDQLGMDPLRDRSYEAIMSVKQYTLYTVSESDKYNLPLIAERAYRNSEAWWWILVYNRIADAFHVTPGTKLRIPQYSAVVNALANTFQTTKAVRTQAI